MAQSRIEELEAEIRGYEDVIALLKGDNQQLVDQNKKLESKVDELNDEIEELQEEQPDFESYQICHQEVRLELEESTIQMEDFFHRLSEKSKQYAGLNQLIQAIEKL